ncbi:MAG: Crp/Fnr family transcriptional regulator [Bacteroidia bacterium]|jgi:CRP/FNR family transcriptional regulator|nr:Crp/Fnr family transcriptional regulator [Bacteroidia bacterium]MCO5254353.1 Crp/Fnr family transcriptional regulator [Bacteroidota bacterium]MCZ2129530.1 Crp/Fnr family transcriptional regulator [Bacteroidia bacterium]
MEDKLNSKNCAFCGHRSHSIFCNSSGDNINEINDGKVTSEYKKGQFLFYEGAHPHGLFCINNGKVKLSQMGDEGKETIVRLAKSGDIIGYKALLGGNRYTASAIALEDSTICFIPKETFFTVLKKDPNLSFSLLSLLSSELHNAENKIVQLAQKPVRERLAEALLFLRETYGMEADGATLDVQLSREEIANIVGTATESTIRLLSEFKKDGIIDIVGKKIKVLDKDKLVKTANVPY